MTAVEAKERREEEVHRRASDALVWHVQQRSVAIVGLRERRLPEHGTGTCIQVGQRFFVATAGHVIRDRGSAQLALVSTLHPRHSQLPVHRYGYRGGDVGDVDVGWIELEPEEAVQTGRVFVPVDRLRPYCRHLQDDQTHAFGFPGGLTTRALRGRTLHLGYQPILYTSRTLEPERWPTEGNPEVDIYLHYSKGGQTRTTGEPIDTVYPSGMSGGGIWVSPIPATGIWSPEMAHLIGIEKSAWPDKEFLRGTQIQHWIQMIAEEFPELQPALSPKSG